MATPPMVSVNKGARRERPRQVWCSRPGGSWARRRDNRRLAATFRGGGGGRAAQGVREVIRQGAEVRWPPGERLARGRHAANAPQNSWQRRAGNGCAHEGFPPRAAPSPVAVGRSARPDCDPGGERRSGGRSLNYTPGWQENPGCRRRRFRAGRWLSQRPDTSGLPLQLLGSADGWFLAILMASSSQARSSAGGVQAASASKVAQRQASAGGGRSRRMPRRGAKQRPAARAR